MEMEMMEETMMGRGGVVVVVDVERGERREALAGPSGNTRMYLASGGITKTQLRTHPRMRHLGSVCSRLHDQHFQHQCWGFRSGFFHVKKCRCVWTRSSLVHAVMRWELVRARESVLF